MNVKFNIRCTMTAAWKFFESFSMHVATSLGIFYATYKNIREFLLLLFTKLYLPKKINWKFVLII